MTLAFVLCFCASGFADIERYDLTGRGELSPMEVKGWNFLHYRMQDGSGVLHYLVSPKKKSRTSVVESMGQAMEYLALIGDRELFSWYAEATERYFKDKKDYFYYWEIDIPKKKGSPTTALVDDLRIFKAYDIANRKKMGDYGGKMAELAREFYLLETNPEGYPVSYYNNEAGARDAGVDTFYLDVDVMKRLGAYDARWLATAERARAILLGMPPHAFGFYPVRYEIDQKKYSHKPTFNMVENLYTALFLKSAGGDVKPFVNFLKREAEAGVLYNIYNSDGTNAEPHESAAVYALAARFMRLVGERAVADFYFKKLLSIQLGVDSPSMGGFSMDSDESVYAFDQLEALLTLRLFD